jgi:hypothetical protein
VHVVPEEHAVPAGLLDADAEVDQRRRFGHVGDAQCHPDRGRTRCFSFGHAARIAPETGHPLAGSKRNPGR